MQFHRALDRDERERFQRNHSLSLRLYMPDHAYVEHLDSDARQRLEQDPLVRAVVPFPEDLKAPPNRGRRNFTSTVARDRAARTAAVGGPGIEGRQRFEVVLFPDVDPDAAITRLRDVGAEDVTKLDDRELGGSLKAQFDATDATAQAVAQLVDVRWIDVMGEARVDGTTPIAPPTAVRPWATPLWSLGLAGHGHIIGMLDSPIDLDHRFFADPGRPIGTRHRKIVGFRNLVNEPPARHGTFVAGIAAADDPAFPGRDSDRGAAWGARLTFGNADDVAGTGMLRYLDAARADGAFVHTNSWHDEPEIQYNQLAAEVDNFTWLHEDQVVVASAGNRNEALGPPGTAKNALCVAAAQGDGEVFGDGATGPSRDGRQKPELMVPGCSVRSAVSMPNSGPDVDLDQHVFLSLGRICASSWATSAAAALAVLIRQYFLDGFYPTGTPQVSDRIVPTSALLRATLLARCMPQNAPAQYPDREAGWGLVHLDHLLPTSSDRPRLRVFDIRHAIGLSTGETKTHRFDVSRSTRPLAVTLVWTDPPGLAGASEPMVNDLELVLIPPDGSGPIRSNAFDAGFSVPDSAPNVHGTVGRVLVRSPALGTWTAQVRAHAVNIGRPNQGYAIVATGDLALETGR